MFHDASDERPQMGPDKRRNLGPASPGEDLLTVETPPPNASRYSNFDKQRRLFLQQNLIFDVDSVAFRSPTYDPTYAYSLWVHQRQLEERQDAAPSPQIQELNAQKNAPAPPAPALMATSTAPPGEAGAGNGPATAISTVAGVNVPGTRAVAEVSSSAAASLSSSSSSSSSLTSSSASATLPANGRNSFADLQRDITEQMRTVLLEWLNEVATEYKMQTSTYFLAVRLLDRILKLLPMRRSKFQLLGCACLMIAAKLEEVECPTAESWVFLSDNSFSMEALTAMENVVLQALDFRISVHTSYYFMHRLAIAARLTDKERSYATMLLEVAQHDFSLVAYERMSKVPAEPF